MNWSTVSQCRCRCRCRCAITLYRCFCLLLFFSLFSLSLSLSPNSLPFLFLLIMCCSIGAYSLTHNDCHTRFSTAYTEQIQYHCHSLTHSHAHIHTYSNRQKRTRTPQNWSIRYHNMLSSFAHGFILRKKGTDSLDQNDENKRTAKQFKHRKPSILIQIIFSSNFHHNFTKGRKWNTKHVYSIIKNKLYASHINHEKLNRSHSTRLATTK